MRQEKSSEDCEICYGTKLQSFNGKYVSCSCCNVEVPVKKPRRKETIKENIKEEEPQRTTAEDFEKLASNSIRISSGVSRFNYEEVLSYKMNNIKLLLDNKMITETEFIRYRNQINDEFYENVRQSSK